MIPRTRLAEVLREIDALAAEYGLRVANVFHAGDGNLHPLVCYDDAVEGEAARAEELAGKIIRACVDAGGSITGEHGVGVDKRDYMSAMFGEADLETFQRLRCAFDPHGLANPGKVMPTPRLCGEVPGPVPRASPGACGDRAADVMMGTLSSVEPETFEQAAQALAELTARGARGADQRRRHQADWGTARQRADLPLRTGGLNRILAHDPGI